MADDMVDAGAARGGKAPVAFLGEIQVMIESELAHVGIDVMSGHADLGLQFVKTLGGQFPDYPHLLELFFITKGGVSLKQQTDHLSIQDT